MALVLGQAGRMLAHDAPGRAAWAHSGALAAVQRAAEAAPPGSELAEAIQARIMIGCRHLCVQESQHYRLFLSSKQIRRAHVHMGPCV